MNAQAVSPERRAEVRAARPQRPAAPALPPLDVLDQTHRQMLVTLDDLAGLIEQLETSGDNPALRQRAQGICSFLDSQARQHHADEEALVFPALLRRGDPVLVQHVHRLQQDHGWLEEDWLALQPQLQAVAHGHCWYEIDTLRQWTAVYTALYREHIGLEEALAYPQARAQLQMEDEALRLRRAASD